MPSPVMSQSVYTETTLWGCFRWRNAITPARQSFFRTFCSESFHSLDYQPVCWSTTNFPMISGFLPMRNWQKTWWWLPNFSVMNGSLYYSPIALSSFSTMWIFLCSRKYDAWMPVFCKSQQRCEVSAEIWRIDWLIDWLCDWSTEWSIDWLI